MGFVVFVDQAFEFFEGAVEFGAGQRRRQVVENNGLGTAFGLGALAGVVDDEGIQVGHGAEHGLGVAVLAEPDPLAG